MEINLSGMIIEKSRLRFRWSCCGGVSMGSKRGEVG